MRHGALLQVDNATDDVIELLLAAGGGGGSSVQAHGLPVESGGGLAPVGPGTSAASTNDFTPGITSINTITTTIVDLQ